MPKFRGENFHRWLLLVSQAAKFMEVFSLENFPLYGMLYAEAYLYVRMYGRDHTSASSGMYMYIIINIILYCTQAN